MGIFTKRRKCSYYKCFNGLPNEAYMEKTVHDSPQKSDKEKSMTTTNK